MSNVPDSRAAWLASHALPHEPALRVWLSRRFLAGLDIDDVVQETYARLAELESIDHILSPRTYLFQVAKTVVLMQMRRLKVLPIDTVEDFEALDVAAADPTPEQVASDRQELKRIEAMIAALPRKPREVFILRKVEGLSQRETARKLGLSESTVEKHMAKCVRVLMDAMKHSGKSRAGASSPIGLEDEPGNDGPRHKRTH
jgi:RNA polymerase sigma-70 factor (ECF subfamily)